MPDDQTAKKSVEDRNALDIIFDVKSQIMRQFYDVSCMKYAELLAQGGWFSASYQANIMPISIYDSVDTQ